MIRLMIGEVDFREVQSPTYGIDQADLASALRNDIFASESFATAALGDLVTHVAGGEHQAFQTGQVELAQVWFDPELAVGQFSTYAGYHWKSLCVSRV